ATAAVERLRDAHKIGEGQANLALRNLDTLYNEIGEGIEESFKKTEKAEKKRTKSHRKSGNDRLEAERAATLLLMGEMDRRIAESDAKHDAMIKKLSRNEGLRLGVIQRKQDDEAKIRAEFSDAETAAFNAAAMATLSDTQRSFADRRAAVISEYGGIIEAVRDISPQLALELSGVQQGLLSGINEEEEALAITRAQELAHAVTDPYVQAWEGAKDKIDEISASMAETRERNAKQDAALFKTIGSSFVGTYTKMLQGGMSTREQQFSVMGDMFGQIGGAFLQWATAEGALLSGNPLAAAGAALALQAISGTISSFGSRGSGGGAAPVSDLATRAMEDDRDDEETPAGVTIYNYGLTTPDEIVASIGRGVRRDRDLSGV
ncbi:MAG: hypothetical protein JRG95_25220, partial [Deltaproteobacteria bacterium]|nr:hypothetical protein [Deltaproteobacteria bacterium]